MIEPTARPGERPAMLLIVDDEPQNRKLLEALLRPEGYQTCCAVDGEQALAMIARQPPDLILLDVMMPGMDGYEVARRLKAMASTANIPIIMLTAQVDRRARVLGLDAGAEEFLTKPVDRAELWLRVRNLLRLKAQGDLLRDHRALLEQQVRLRTLELQRFRTAMDATAEAILLTSRATLRFIEVNATACSMLGYSREEFFAMGLAELTGISDDELRRRHADGLAESGGDALSELKLRRQDGSELQVELHNQVQCFDDDWIIVSVMRDITERKLAQQRLHHLAHYDALTGLPNRTQFYKTLERTLLQARDGGGQVAVMFIDLDNFKNVNDTLGHAVGDDLLEQISTRLVHCVRTHDTVGRLGGDEFAMILMLPDGPQGAAIVARKVREVLRHPFDLQGHETTVTASIGITLHPGDASDPETLLKYADTAMYQAKQAGRDTARFFTAQMNTDVLARIDLEAALRKAVDNEEFVLHFQPKVRLNSGEIVGVEALLRWRRPGHGLVSPKDFVPLLEDTGLIVRVGAWVLRAACRQMAAWQRTAIGPMQVAVNVSVRQFVDGDLEADVRAALAEHGLDAGLLELEITEGSLMVNTDRTVAILRNLKQLGVHVSIDDFGTGYSSLAYLRRFPIDKLKIDIAFIRDITSNADDATIALAIIRMAHSLKLEVIAEGVETAGQLAYLRRHRCDQVQGYFFSKPLALAATERMLLQRRRLVQAGTFVPATRAGGAIAG